MTHKFMYKDGVGEKVALTDVDELLRQGWTHRPKAADPKGTTREKPKGGSKPTLEPPEKKEGGSEEKGSGLFQKVFSKKKPNKKGVRR